MTHEKIKGKWWQIKKTKNIKKIKSKYDKIKDWKIDPNGYFLIDIDKNKKLIRVGYCKFKNLNKKNEIHKLVAEIYGKSAIEVVNTLIKLKFISTMQHAADMAIELTKAEFAIKYNKIYIQDMDI